MELRDEVVAATGVSTPGEAAEADEAVSSIRPVELQSALAESTTVGLGDAALSAQPQSAAGQKIVLPNVLAGKDPSQLAAAEYLRLSGGVPATELLLGLDQPPPVAGLFLAPPGNSEALRHLSEPVRRSLLHSLLLRQRESLRRVSQLLYDDRGEDEDHDPDGADEWDGGGESSAGAAPLRRPELRHLRDDLSHAAAMLDLIEDLLLMQDYILGQVSTFAKG